jgi:hypothetical protein
MEIIKQGTVIHNGREYKYVVDSNREVWFIDKVGAKTNIGQVRPLINLDDAEDVVIQMLKAVGY